MKIGKYTISQLRKTVVAVIGTAILLVNSLAAELGAYLPAPWVVGINVVVGIATAVSVFLTKNAPLIDAADNFQ